MKDYTKYTGALVILEDYLDNALYDYENGNTFNTTLIEDCINAWEELSDPIVVQFDNEYRERFEKAKKVK